jgi:hypothetical protein
MCKITLCILNSLLCNLMTCVNTKLDHFVIHSFHLISHHATLPLDYFKTAKLCKINCY